MNSFAEFLARVGAIKFGEFKLKSGRISPYFINTGAISSGKDIYTLASFFADKIKDIDCEIIFGPAYKGIPLAVSISIALSKEYGLDRYYLFDRKESKTHGDKGDFVGRLPKSGERIILVDDVMTTGGTKKEAVKKLESLGADVVGVVIAVDREEKGKEKSAIAEFEDEMGIPVYPITTISSIFKDLKGKNIDGKILINDDIYNSFLRYIQLYGASHP